MTKKYGIIGCGMMGHEHVANIGLLDGAEVGGVYDPVPELAQSCSEKSGGAQVYGSVKEIASAGLDALTDAEREAFTKLNAAYTAKHGFPFIIAVRDYTKAQIIEAFTARIDNDSATEMAEACRQVERIAALRLKDLLG